MNDLAHYNDLQAFIVAHESEQAKALGDLLWEILAPASVIDIGCGPGIYLLPFEDRGCEVFGIDGAPLAGKAVRGRFQHVDLRLPYFPRQVYQLALCIEVAEHLAPEYADVLMDTVCRSADTIFFSAARPGQGGTDHLNEQPQAYWLDRFAARGFQMHSAHRAVVARINAGEVFQKVGWLCHNAMLLARA